MSAFPAHLLDHWVLARKVYEYWMSVLRTDNVPEEETISWEDMDKVYQEDFAEAIRVHVTELFQGYLDESIREAVDVETSRPDPVQVDPSKWTSACYSCEKYAVPETGKMCAYCHYALAAR